MSTGKSVYKWTAIDRICNSVMTFGGNLFLARMLDPSDFGLLAMVAIFSALAQNISGCGMSDGLINKKDPTSLDYSTVFVFNISMGIFFAILFISCSSLLARYFNLIEIRGIMIAIGICFFFKTVCMVQETRMRKELDFKKMALVRLSATASSLILAVVLVLNGYSYWGIVSMQVFLSVFMCLYYILASRWLPRIAFSIQSFKEMFGYGIHLMLAYICYQTARNINTSLLAKVSTASVSGAYSQGQKLEEVPFALSEAILNWPFFAVLSSAPDWNKRRIITSQMHSMLVFVNTVIATFLFAVSTYAFNALYGPKWNEAIPIFNVLLIFGLATAVKLFYQTIFKAHSKTRLIRNMTVLEVVIQLVLLFIFCRKGPIVIALTQTIPALVILLLYIPIYIRLEKINIRKYIKETSMPFFLPFFVMLITVVLTYSWANSINIWLALAAVSFVYVMIMFVFCELFKPEFYLNLRMHFVKPSEDSQ